MSAAPTVAAIKQAVAAEFGLSLAELDSTRRTRRQAVPRHIAIWLAMELTRNSSSVIARLFNRTDHTTILHAAHRAQELMRGDPLLAERVRQLCARLRRSAAPEVTAQIRETSVALAIEQALEFADAGYTPAQALEAAGIPWRGRAPSWEDAVWSLAMAWRQRCAPTALIRGVAA